VAYVIDKHSDQAFPGKSQAMKFNSHCLPEGVTNYSAKLQLFPVTNGNKTYAHWSASWQGTNWEPTKEAITNLFHFILGEAEKLAQA
jgi:hypothetical protein